MHPKLTIASTIVAAVFALGMCDKVEELKSKIPIPGLGGEEGDEGEKKAEKKDGEKKDGEKKTVEKKASADEGDDTGDEEKDSGDEKASAEEGEDSGDEEKDSGDEKVAAKEEKEEEEPAEPKATKPTGDATVKSDIPATIKTKTKIEKVLVIAHKDELKKYGPPTKKVNKQIKECHRSALVDNPKATGKIKFRITVDAEGKATDVTVEINKTGSDDLAACCAAAFEAHSWPRRNDGEERVLAVPIMFKVP